MKPVEIRRASADDADRLAELRYEFRAELDPPTESRLDFVERCATWMKRALQPGGQWQCWLAIVEDTPVGTLWLQRIEKLPNPVGHPIYHGYVSSVYVVPSVRNAGVGSALLQAGVAHARGTGIDSLFLWPSERSRPLYARHGFAVSTDILERR